MAGAAVVPEAGAELAKASSEDTEECGDDQGDSGHSPGVGIPRGRVRPVVSGKGLTHKQREELHRGQTGDVRHVVLDRHVPIGDEEQDDDGRDAEAKAVGVSSGQSVGESPCSQVGADIGGQEERGTAGEDAKQ